MELNKIYQGDSLSIVNTFPDNCIDCCITSPPYWGLRDYGVLGQIGVEDTPELFANKLADLFDGVKRCLKESGTLWLNLGDSYISAKSDYMPNQTIAGGGARDYVKKESGIGYPPNRRNQVGYKTKDLVGIPWLVAFELRKRGWWLRCDIIWNKPNPMPESVKDRPTKSHEYIFLLSKSERYYYDYESIMEDSVDPESYTGRKERNAPTMAKHDLKNLKNAGSIQENGKLTSGQVYEKRNKRSVWDVTTMPYKDSHFATFPERLITDMIKAGCPEGGIILDPFMGAGTTAVVAKKLNRNYVGVELNPKYIKIAEKRLYKEIGMFL